MKELVIVKETLPEVKSGSDQAGLIIALLLFLAAGIAIALKVQQETKENEAKKYKLDRNGKFIRSS